MITIFNRKELAFTFDLKRLNEVRTKLETHNIKYALNPFEISDILNAGNYKTSNEFKIYVKKSDYDFASAVIEDKITWDNGGK